MLFEPILSTDLVHLDLPDTTMVEGGLLHHGSRLILAGEAGSGKTYLTLQLLLEAALGEPWLGIFPSRKSFSCLYIQTEITLPLFKERLLRWSSGYKLPPIHLLTTREFDITRDVHKVMEFATTHGIDIVAFDPLCEIHSGDENQVHTIRPVKRAFDSVASGERAIIIDHHINKASQFSGIRPGLVWLRGSSGWAGWADTVLLIMAKPGVPVVWLHIVKARNRQDALPGMVELRWHIGGGKFFEVTEIRQDSEFADLLEIVGDGMSRTDAAKSLSEMRGMSLSTAYRVIREAVSMGVVEIDEGKVSPIG